MYRLTLFLFALWMGIFSPVASAKTPEQQLQDVAWVVFCEDNTTQKASMMVLSTIYNRAKSHDLDKLHKAVSAKKQYHCYRIPPTAKKLNSKKFQQIKSMVAAFIAQKKPPITRAVYFYNHKQVTQDRLGKMRLTVAQVYGAHTYLY